MSLVVKHSFYFISLLTTVFYSFVCNAQMEKMIVRGGNEQYHNGQYEAAVQSYKAAVKKKPSYNKAYYNLGAAEYKAAMNLKKNAEFKAKYGPQADSIIKQVFAEAGNNFDVFANGKTSSKDSAQCAMHNLGNSYLMQKEYQKAVDSYKKALKYNPKDEDTRYNLAYAQKKLSEQQKNDKNNKNKQNQDQKQDKENQKQDIKNKNDKQEQKESSQLSKEDAQRMLDALKNAENKMQAVKKLKGDKKEDQKQVEKDW